MLVLHLKCPIWALSSAGRAVLLQSKGQEFESPRVHTKKKRIHFGALFCSRKFLKYLAQFFLKFLF